MAGNPIERGGGLMGGYGRRGSEGPPTYTDATFMQKIVAATGLNELDRPATVIDIMSGPGKLGLGIRKAAPQHNYMFLDLSRPRTRTQIEAGVTASQIEEIPSDVLGRVSGDVRKLPLGPTPLEGGERQPVADVVVVRYGLKDLTAEEQSKVLKEVATILRPGGRLVVADMVAPDGAKEWLNEHHAKKQELSGRTPQEGVCHIPTEEEWISLLEGAGLQAQVSAGHKSYVTTSDWVRHNQITDEQRAEMDANILGAPSSVIEAFNVRQEGDDVKIDYPVLILTATKPVIEGETNPEEEAVSPRAVAIAERYFQEFGRVEDAFDEHFMATSIPAIPLIEDQLVTATAKALDSILREGETPSLVGIAESMVTHLDRGAMQEELDRDGEVFDDPLSIARNAIITGSKLAPHYASLPSLIAMSQQAKALETELGLPEGAAYADERHFGELIKSTYGSAETFVTVELDRIDGISGETFQGLAEDIRSEWTDADEGLQTLRGAFHNVVFESSGVNVTFAVEGGKQILRSKCIEDASRFWGYASIDSLPENLRQRAGLR